MPDQSVSPETKLLVELSSPETQERLSDLAFEMQYRFQLVQRELNRKNRSAADIAKHAEKYLDCVSEFVSFLTL